MTHLCRMKSIPSRTASKRTHSDFSFQNRETFGSHRNFERKVTTLQIVSTSHNQLWDRIYFFGQFGFGRVLKSIKNPNNDPQDSRASKEAKRREIQLKFEKVSQYFPSKLLETIPNPLYRVDLVIYGWIR